MHVTIHTISVLFKKHQFVKSHLKKLIPAILGPNQPSPMSKHSVMIGRKKSLLTGRDLSYNQAKKGVHRDKNTRTKYRNYIQTQRK